MNRTASLGLSIGHLAVAAAMSVSHCAQAQTPPDSGRILQQQAPLPGPPAATPDLRLQAPEPTATISGGARVTLRSVVFSGNVRFDAETLNAVLGGIDGETYDMAGLRSVAQRITSHYRSAGYPFARAFLPPQDLQDGVLRVEILEGRYGEVKAVGAAALAPQAQSFLRTLNAGQVIESKSLERATLILADQPGLSVTPVIRPGQEFGTGDLGVHVEQLSRFGADVSMDNHGNRYNGEHQVRADVRFDSPFMLGDQVTLRGLFSEAGLWLGSLGYGLPLGSSGLRGNVGYAHTSYELGKQFAALDATGTADVGSIGLSYPILRSRKANLTVSSLYQHKALNDRQGATDTSFDKSSDSLPLTLNFDLRDAVGGGGITYGAVAWTHGRLGLDAGLNAIDRATARTDGDFVKYNLDVARLQALPNRFSAYARFSAQWANANLDSSEGFGLGGGNGVRAYPVGEGYGDEGWLAQLELRYSLSALAPYAFYDLGRVTLDAKPWVAGDNHRSIAGAGAGLRLQQQAWSADAVVAWRAQGGKPESDTQDRDPRVWVSGAYRF